MDSGYMFERTAIAGKLLAEKLKPERFADAVVLAVPNGGLVLGSVLAHILKLPLEVSLIEEIGHMLNQDFPIGYIGLNSRDISWASNTPMDYINTETKKIQLKLLEKHNTFTGREEPLSIYNRTVILTSDNIGYCDNFIKNISIARKNNPLKIIAVTDTIDERCMKNILKECDELIFLESTSELKKVESMLPDYSQVDEQEIMKFIHGFTEH